MKKYDFSIYLKSHLEIQRYFTVEILSSSHRGDLQDTEGYIWRIEKAETQRLQDSFKMRADSGTQITVMCSSLCCSLMKQGV